MRYNIIIQLLEYLSHAERVKKLNSNKLLFPACLNLFMRCFDVSIPPLRDVTGIAAALRVGRQEIVTRQTGGGGDVPQPNPLPLNHANQNISGTVQYLPPSTNKTRESAELTRKIIPKKLFYYERKIFN